MRKVLILGGSYRDIGLIKACQELGYYTITLGSRDDYIGHNYADSFYKLDYNDFDSIKEIIKKEPIDYLIAGSGEGPYINTVQLSEELQIGNYDTLATAELVHNKWKFKNFCLKNAISVPQGFYYIDHSSLEQLKFPAIVKPVNLSGGKGVAKVNDIQELELELKKAKNMSDNIMIEEFIEGEIISYSVVISKQKIVYEFIAKEYTYVNKYVISSAHPHKLDSTVMVKLKNDVEKICKLLSLVDGMFHLQVLIKDNKPYIMDVTRRIAGDLYPNLIELSDNVSYLKSVVKGYVGKEITDEFENKFKQPKFVIRHCVFPKHNGILEGIVVDDSLKNKIIDRIDLLESNTYIDNYLTSLTAIVFIVLESYDENIMENINGLIYPKVNRSESND